jgi:hypothetical protein
MPGVGPAYFMILGEVPKKKLRCKNIQHFPQIMEIKQVGG